MRSCVIVPNAVAVVERDEHASAELSVPTCPIGFVLPVNDEDRIMVFMPTAEDVIAFAELLLRETRNYVNNTKIREPGPVN